MLADYHLIRMHKLNLPDLYKGDASSIYWFYKGFNWRGPVAFLMGMWPLLRTSFSLFSIIYKYIYIYPLPKEKRSTA